jgi:D-alanine-D-alanine ligase
MIEDLNRKKIGVLMGGLSVEREISLVSGERVLDSLLSQGYHAVGIDADRSVSRRLEEEEIEIACIMLHGRFGEDGTIQGLLELMGIPYTGSGVLASALSMNKIASKIIFRSEGIPTPEFVSLPHEGDVEKTIDLARKTLPFPVVVKPVHEGSSVGVVIAKDEVEMRRAIQEDRERYSDVMMERYIGGTSVTVGILGCGSGTRVLPVLELRPKREFYDYEAKYTPGMTEFVCPAELDPNAYGFTQKYAILAHSCLGCHGFSRVDLQVDKNGNPFVLEINTIPGMTKLSDLPAEAEAEGISYNNLVKEILRSAHLDGGIA